MFMRPKSTLAARTLIVLASAAALNSGCGNRTNPGEGDGSAEASGEPERYSATVVRVVEDGTRRETSISREARAGDQRREEWTQDGQRKALIWRPDLGKAFLLDVDERAYVEIEIGAARPLESRAAGANSRIVPSARNQIDVGFEDHTVQAIDRYFDDWQPPASVETRALSEALIDGHLCAVHEQRSIFPDGHTETVRRFRARDLFGLLVRVETEAEPGSAKVITERRDVRVEVAPDMFIVPNDFKRVQKPPR